MSKKARGYVSVHRCVCVCVCAWMGREELEKSHKHEVEQLLFDGSQSLTLQAVTIRRSILMIVSIFYSLLFYFTSSREVGNFRSNNPIEL